MKQIALLPLLSLTALFLCSAASGEDLLEAKEVRYLMGTRGQVTLFHPDRHEGRRIIRKAFKIAEDLDRLLSNFKPTSEITLLNADTEKTEKRVSEEFYRFLDTSQQLTRRTAGAFDITVSPLIDLWRIARQKKRLPDRNQLKETRTLVGSHHFSLLPNRKVIFENPALQLHSGGVGKGYAADQMITFLKKEGIQHALVNIGESSIVAIGAPPGSSSWQVVFTFPDSDPIGVVRLNNAALSASDSHASSYTIDEASYGHIIDPATGFPTTVQVKAAAVAPSGAEAEALTKFLVLRGWNNSTAQKHWNSAQAYIQKAGTVFMTADFPLTK
jgi:thiamine biosynthesis lipoprotein